MFVARFDLYPATKSAFVHDRLAWPAIAMATVLLSVASHSLYGQTSQLKPDSVTPVEEILNVLAQFRQQGGATPKLIETLSFKALELEQSGVYDNLVIGNWTEYKREVEKKAEELDIDENSMAEMAAKETGLPPMSKASVELLISNCLVELQKLEWDIASETVIASAPQDRTKMIAVKAKLGTQQKIIESLEQQLVLATKNLARLKLLHEKGTVPEHEINDQSIVVEKMQVDISSAKGMMEVAEAEQEAQLDASNTASAIRLRQFQARRQAVQIQLDKLQVHQKLMSRLERQSNMTKINEQKLQVIEEKLLDKQIQMLQTSTLISVIRQAIDSAQKDRK